MKSFICKSVTITLCLAFLLFCFLPGQKRYKFEATNKRFDLLSGKSEFYSYDYPKGWREY